MKKRFNDMIISSIFTSVALLVIGLIMLVFPESLMTIFGLMLSLLLIIRGVYLIFLDIQMKDFDLNDTSTYGIALVLIGIVLIIYPKVLSTIIPIVLGIWFISKSIFKIRLSLALKSTDNNAWIIGIIMAVLSILCGVILILDPIGSMVTVTIVAGSMMVVYAISDIIGMYTFKQNFEKIINYFDIKE